MILMKVEIRHFITQLKKKISRKHVFYLEAALILIKLILPIKRFGPKYHLAHPIPLLIIIVHTIIQVMYLVVFPSSFSSIDQIPALSPLIYQLNILVFIGQDYLQSHFLSLKNAIAIPKRPSRLGKLQK